MTTLGDLAELVRAPGALSVPGDVLAGAAVTGTLGPRAAGLSAASVCLYWAGLAANDWADRKLDAKERPERPIPSGRVTPGTAFGIAVALTGAGLGLAGLASGRRALGVAAALAGTVWWYDCALKGTAAGPAAMAACRGLDVLLGGRLPDDPDDGPVLLCSSAQAARAHCAATEVKGILLQLAGFGPRGPA